MRIVRTLQNALKKYMMYRMENGAYKFFVQKLEAVPDIDLAAAILGTDYFRHNLKPLPFSIEGISKVVLFAPHQDDEVLGAGGLLCALRDRGVEIHIVFLTDGENPSYTMAEIRRQEARTVAKRLKATMHEIGISNVTLEVSSRHLEAIASIVTEVDPELLMGTWPLDAPPIHRLGSAIVAKALGRIEGDPNRQVLCYPVHTALIPNVYFDYTPYHDEKMELIDLYASQMNDQNYRHLSEGLDAWNSRFLPWSKESRYVEIFTQLPLKEYVRMIETFYPKDLRQTFRGNVKCIESFKNLERL